MYPLCTFLGRSLLKRAIGISSPSSPSISLPSSLSSLSFFCVGITGFMYFEDVAKEYMPNPHPVDAAMKDVYTVHANYIVGYDNKKVRLKRKNVWLVNDENALKCQLTTTTTLQ
jgi:hypothetical protein